MLRALRPSPKTQSPSRSRYRALPWVAAGLLLWLCQLLLKPTIGSCCRRQLLVASVSANRPPVALPKRIRRLLAFATGFLMPFGPLLYYFAKRSESDLSRRCWSSARLTRLGWRAPTLQASLSPWCGVGCKGSPYSYRPLVSRPFEAGDARSSTGSVACGTGRSLLLAGVLVQAKLFPYHFAPALLLTALPAGWGFWTLWMRARRRQLGTTEY